MKVKKPKKSPRPRPRRRRPTLKAPSHVYYLLDTKGEVFDIHTSRQDAWHDATGPRFYKGFYIVEYARCGMRRYDYNKEPGNGVR